ncbi:hypothetical protein ABID97_001084 [Variovorax sp. OAS795]|uniref:hypothetical protein n=1 Tax=Variovorax sp. OAS795 TaxID=3034231 RepID=UPI003395F9D2
MKYNALTGLVFASFFCGGCSGQISKNLDACRLNVPPLDSEVRETHAGKIFSYPPDVGGKYSGCKKAWLEDGSPLLFLELKNGSIRKVDAFEDGAIGLACVLMVTANCWRGAQENVCH